MFGTPNYNQINIDRINNQIRELEALKGQYQNIPMQNQPSINQTFQLANNSNGIKYANSVDEVKNELVFNDTLFINKDYSILWLKNASGAIKTYSLSEIVEMDEKDRKINELMSKIDILEKEIKKNESTNGNEFINDTVESKKPTNSKSNK